MFLPDLSPSCQEKSLYKSELKILYPFPESLLAAIGFICSIKTAEAYAELISIGPEIIQILLLFPLYRILLFSSFSRLIQPDVVKIHLARTAGNSRVALGTKTNRDLINIG